MGDVMCFFYLPVSHRHAFLFILEDNLDVQTYCLMSPSFWSTFLKFYDWSFLFVFIRTQFVFFACSLPFSMFWIKTRMRMRMSATYASTLFATVWACLCESEMKQVKIENKSNWAVGQFLNIFSEWMQGSSTLFTIPLNCCPDVLDAWTCA